MGVVLEEPSFAPPSDRGDELHHNAEFEKWDTIVCEARDIVNEGIGILNGMGAGLGTLPEGTLRDLFIEPITGDPTAIRRNADACKVLDDGIAVIAANLGRSLTWIEPRWGGQAAVSLGVDLGARGLGMRAFGELIGQGSRAFDAIATFVERMMVKLEGLVVELGHILQRLMKKVASRLLGGAGAALMALDVLTDGLDAFTDIIDDVKRAFEIFETLMNLKDEVSGWVEEQREQLSELMSLVSMLDALEGRSPV